MYEHRCRVRFFDHWKQVRNCGNFGDRRAGERMIVGGGKPAAYIFRNVCLDHISVFRMDFSNAAMFSDQLKNFIDAELFEHDLPAVDGKHLDGGKSTRQDVPDIRQRLIIQMCDRAMEGIIDDRHILCRMHPFFKRLYRAFIPHGYGELHHCSGSAIGGGNRAGFHLVLGEKFSLRIVNMDMGIDQSRHHKLSGGVNGFNCLAEIRFSADAGDFSVFDADIRINRPVCIYNVTAADNEVKHRKSSPRNF